MWPSFWISARQTILITTWKVAWLCHCHHHHNTFSAVIHYHQGWSHWKFLVGCPKSHISGRQIWGSARKFLWWVVLFFGPEIFGIRDRNGQKLAHFQIIAIVVLFWCVVNMLSRPSKRLMMIFLYWAYSPKMTHISFWAPKVRFFGLPDNKTRFWWFRFAQLWLLNFATAIQVAP